MPGGGNFSSPLPIDKQGHIVPTGPLSVPQDETITKLYAWVLQEKPDGTGAMCAASQEAEGFVGLAGQSIWTAKARPIHEGRFDPGPAVGVAVLISRHHVDGEPRVFWWWDNIALE